jgi:hypothetical protein
MNPPPGLVRVARAVVAAQRIEADEVLETGLAGEQVLGKREQPAELLVVRDQPQFAIEHAQPAGQVLDHAGQQGIGRVLLGGGRRHGWGSHPFGQCAADDTCGSGLAGAADGSSEGRRRIATKIAA